jgi:hypothetical protein
MYLGGDESLVSREWMDTHIREGHGPLGALYPPKTWTAPNPHAATKEGDTPSWFYFLPSGLSDPLHPNWGSWGGRFEKSPTGRWQDAQDTIGGVTSSRATVWRWREAFQADFQARLDWCVAEDFKQANHAPIAVLNGDTTNHPLKINAKPGETIKLTAEGSHDPDGDALEARWFVYPEAGSFSGDIKPSGLQSLTMSFTAPQVKEPAAIHIVLELADNGSPRLRRYRRAVVTVAAAP